VGKLLKVKTPDEVYDIIEYRFAKHEFTSEKVLAADALGRTLHHDILSDEYVPGFNRSTVDGYAVIASDTFGCSESIPATLSLAGEVLMGKSAKGVLSHGICVIVPTGGELPEGSDAVVMVEHSEDFGGGVIGIHRPVAPGNNVIFKGDDVSVGDIVLTAGTELMPHNIGILSALGYCEVDVRKKPVVGVISTGDELVKASDIPAGGQIRDVNTPLLLATAARFGAAAINCGIIHDDEKAMRNAVRQAAKICDIIIISGGSSAGSRDMTARVIESEGEILFHGIAIKPGKPTILGEICGKPVFGLPGHPVAAYLVTELFVRPLTAMLLGAKRKPHTSETRISEAVSSNHGRAEYIVVRLDENGTAFPVRSKSGLIASLSGVDGYICIPRDCEGLPAGAKVIMTYF